jgi:hypothetical protein
MPLRAVYRDRAPSIFAELDTLVTLDELPFQLRLNREQPTASIWASVARIG